MSFDLTSLVPRKDFLNVSGIYAYIEKETGRILYYGKAKSIYTRHKRHISNMKLGTEPKRLSSILNKIGIDNILFTIVETCTIEELDKLEKDYIVKYNPTGNTQLAIHA